MSGQQFARRPIRSFVERIENLDTELQELSERKSEVSQMPRAMASMPRSLKEIIKRRSCQTRRRARHAVRHLSSGD